MIVLNGFDLEVSEAHRAQLVESDLAQRRLVRQASGDRRRRGLWLRPVLWSMCVKLPWVASVCLKMDIRPATMAAFKVR